MINNEMITNMTFEDIEKLTPNQKEQFENFKQYIESHNQSIVNLQRAKENLRHKINEQNSYYKTSKKIIPLKIYLSLSSIIIIGVLFSYTIYKYDALSANQVYIKILILSVNFVIIIFVSFIPLIILLKKY